MMDKGKPGLMDNQKHTVAEIDNNHRAELVEKVGRAQYEAFNEGDGVPWDDFPGPVKDLWRKVAAAAIDLIRAEVLEEAARLIDENHIVHGGDGDRLGPRRDGDQHGLAYATAIRALKEEKPHDR